MCLSTEGVSERGQRYREAKAVKVSCGVSKVGPAGLRFGAAIGDRQWIGRRSDRALFSISPTRSAGSCAARRIPGAGAHLSLWFLLSICRSRRALPEESFNHHGNLRCLACGGHRLCGSLL